MKIFKFIKAHFLSENIIREYSKLLSADKNAVLFIDNHTNFLDITYLNTHIQSFDYDNATLNCFIYDKLIHDELNLPYFENYNKNDDLGKVIWYNSDFPFYIIRKYYPDYDYYWSFEYDVYCNGESYAPFLEQYENINEDMIISKIVKTNFDKNIYSWAYSKDVNLYNSLFAVVRLSGRAIDFLYKKRLEQAVIFDKILQSKTQNNSDKWLFCETFAPTELKNNGYSCTSIADYKKLRFSPVWKLEKYEHFKQYDNKLYHPVK